MTSTSSIPDLDRGPYLRAWWENETQHLVEDEREESQLASLAALPLDLELIKAEMVDGRAQGEVLAGTLMRLQEIVKRHVRPSQGDWVHRAIEIQREVGKDSFPAHLMVILAGLNGDEREDVLEGLQARETWHVRRGRDGREHVVFT